MAPSSFTYSRPLAWLAPLPHLEVIDAFAADTPRSFAPPEGACMDMLRRHDTLPNVLEHCRRVARFAVALAERAVAVRGLVSPENPRGVPRDLVEFALAAGLLHDVAKTWCIRNGGSHAHVGAAWVVAETGNFRVAQAVMHHVEWPWELPEDVCTPALFVNYADRRTMHDTYVTLSERHEDLLVRYGLTEARRESILNSTARGHKLEHALSAQLELALDACTVAGGRLVPRT